MKNPGPDDTVDEIAAGEQRDVRAARVGRIADDDDVPWREATVDDRAQGEIRYYHQE